MQTLKRPLLQFLLLAIGLSACAGLSPGAADLAPTTTACDRAGTAGTDRVPHPAHGFDISFQYYLPPCYDSLTRASFPVLYLITLSFESTLSERDNTPLSLADRLIRAGKMPPAILIVPGPDVNFGYDAALAEDLVPYIDGKFRTIRDRAHRGTGGISQGAAIAARMAFQFPDTFGSVVLWSGGIDASEEERFMQWIAPTPVERRPRVYIDVGDQDDIIRFARNLTAVLDARHVPYEMNIGHGAHSWTYWSTRMEPDLLWLAEAWQ